MRRQPRGVLEEQGLFAFGLLGRGQSQGVAEADARLAGGGAQHRQRRGRVGEGALLVDDATFEGLAEVEGRGFRAGRALHLRASLEGVRQLTPGRIIVEYAHRGDIDGLDAQGQGR